MKAKANKSAVGTVHTLTYGASEIVGFASPWRNEVYRPFAVHPSEPWNREVRESVMADGPKDASPRHNKSTYGTGAGYDARCSCCYLNITHTEALHAKHLKSVS